jgi:hypothetical protein
MSYKRTINLMDESVFPRKSLYAQKENPKIGITDNVQPVKQTNDEIIDYVSKEMLNTLGTKNDSQPR